MKYFLPTILLLLFVFEKAFAQKMNTEAITKFWEVIDYLKKDKPLTDSVWNEYYNLHGNKTYLNNNRSDENAVQHRKYLELVFRPGYIDSLKQFQEKTSGDFNDILQNLIFIKSHEQQIRLCTKQIQQPGYLNTSISLTKKHLPKGKLNTLPKNLTIYIMAITYDAAVQDSNMYFGISCLYDLDRFQKGTMAAHEFHHLLRKNNTLKNKVRAKDSASIDIIDNINNEGCADLIDKSLFIKHEKELLLGSAIKSWLLENATETINKLDSCFRINSSTNSNYITAKQFREIVGFSSGHIPGYYMVNVIKRNGFMNELIAHSNNPFYIFYLYNKSAAIDKLKVPSFSAETIAYLRSLEKYVK